MLQAIADVWLSVRSLQFRHSWFNLKSGYAERFSGTTFCFCAFSTVPVLSEYGHILLRPFLKQSRLDPQHLKNNEQSTGGAGVEHIGADSCQ